MEAERGPHPRLKPFPVLYTPRLCLRKIEFSDAQALFLCAGDARVTRFLEWPTHERIEDSANFIASLQPLYEYGICPQWAIADKASDALMGVVSLSNVDQWHRRADVGYWLGFPYWNQGYAAEAVIEIIQFAFNELGLLRIQAMHIPENTASGVVMQKAGMIYEGMLRQYYFCNGKQNDLCVYAIVKQPG